MRNFIGTSGFSYKDWKKRFYPEKLSSKDWLAFYAQHFSSVEINSSFYHLPSEKTLLNWRRQVPDDFVFVLKGSRFITHRLRLKNAKESVDLFSSHARLLENKLGVIFYQLPPGLHKDLDRLEIFLSLLPKDIKHAVEFRHDSWLDEDTFKLLTDYQVGYCIISAPGLQCRLQATAPFVYIRFHGTTNWYDYNYSDKELQWWAERIREFNQQQFPVYAYFNNDVSGYAVKNAQQLEQFLANK